jgi:hypothetical protein
MQCISLHYSCMCAILYSKLYSHQLAKLRSRMYSAESFFSHAVATLLWLN